MSEAGANADATHHAGNAADMADTMATPAMEFGNGALPLGAAVPEITGVVVTYGIEDKEIDYSGYPKNGRHSIIEAISCQENSA